VVGFAFFAVAPVFNGTRMTFAHAALVSFADVFSFLPFTREAIGGRTCGGREGAAPKG